MSWLGERSRNGGVDEVPLPRPGGRLWLAGKHFVAPDVESALGRVGADVVVCLCEGHELVDRYPRYVRWLEHHYDGRALWRPIPDLHAPTLPAALGLVAELRGRLANGDDLLVHCGAGIGRAGTVAAAVLVSMGVGLADALATVAEHRPMAGPEVGPQRALLDAIAATTARAAPEG